MVKVLDNKHIHCICGRDIHIKNIRRHVSSKIHLKKLETIKNREQGLRDLKSARKQRKEEKTNIS